MNKKAVRGISLYLIIFLVILMTVFFYYDEPEEQVTEIPFSDMIHELSDQNVVSVHMDETVMTAVLRESGRSVVSYASTVMEANAVFDKYVLPQVEEGLIELTSDEPKTTSWFMSMLPTFLILLVFVGIWFFFMNQSQGGGGKVMGFGKNRATLHKEEDLKKVTFADIAGLEEEKEELAEIVDFLRNPQKYINLGARIPKGVLLVGPPVTGKTYISKATAGEAGVPFYSISGSDFVEMFVGVGASRVRDMFAEAKKNTPVLYLSMRSMRWEEKEAQDWAAVMMRENRR